MANKGRMSQAEIELNEQVPEIASSFFNATERPSPPLEFNEMEAAEWIEIVNSMPADWFSRGTIPLLTQYVRHTVASQTLGQLISKLLENEDNFKPELYIKLLRAQKEESAALSSLSTKLRLSNQSLINKRGNHKEVEKKKPWET